jgi:hypothetical protein
MHKVQDYIIAALSSETICSNSAGAKGKGKTE